MSGFLEALASLGPQLAAHVLLSAAAIALGIAVALPLAVWASRSPPVARLALGFASLVQTVPALALLALFFPILLSLRVVLGEGVPTLGFLPALLALALYALLPVLRNAVTAQANLDPGVIEAADGVGMTGWQKLRLVEAPLQCGPSGRPRLPPPSASPALAIRSSPGCKRRTGPWCWPAASPRPGSRWLQTACWAWSSAPWPKGARGWRWRGWAR